VKKHNPKMPLFFSNIAVGSRANGKVATVTPVPEDKALQFKVAGDQVSFTVPTVRGHQIVEVKYA
jgi:hypothetical protein